MSAATQFTVAITILAVFALSVATAGVVCWLRDRRRK